MNSWIPISSSFI